MTDAPMIIEKGLNEMATMVEMVAETVMAMSVETVMKANPEMVLIGITEMMKAGAATDLRGEGVVSEAAVVKGEVEVALAVEVVQQL